jgi:hypothetical protein
MGCSVPNLRQSRQIFNLNELCNKYKIQVLVSQDDRTSSIRLSSGRIFVYTFKEKPKILRIYTRRDPMAQVRNPAFWLLTVPTPETLTHALHLAFDRLAPSIEQVRVKVALQRDAIAYERTGLGWLNCPVQPECVIPGLAREEGKGRIGTFGEER